jgi:hypothetical protein
MGRISQRKILKYLAQQNPRFFETAQHSPNVMMWNGVTDEMIIRPYSFNMSVTGER